MQSTTRASYLLNHRLRSKKPLIGGLRTAVRNSSDHFPREYYWKIRDGVFFQPHPLYSCLCAGAKQGSRRRPIAGPSIQSLQHQQPSKASYRRSSVPLSVTWEIPRSGYAVHGGSTGRSGIHVGTSGCRAVRPTYPTLPSPLDKEEPFFFLLLRYLCSFPNFVWRAYYPARAPSFFFFVFFANSQFTRQPRRPTGARKTVRRRKLAKDWSA